MEKITRKNNCPNTNRRYKNPSPDTNKSLLYTSNIYKREKEKYQIYTSILRKYKYRTNKYFKRHFQQEKKKKENIPIQKSKHKNTRLLPLLRSIIFLSIHFLPRISKSSREIEKNSLDLFDRITSCRHLMKLSNEIGIEPSVVNFNFVRLRSNLTLDEFVKQRTVSPSCVQGQKINILTG